MIVLLMLIATSTVLGTHYYTSQHHRLTKCLSARRAGRFGTKGLAITFVSSDADQQVMGAIQSRFEVAVPELPEHIDPASYSECGIFHESRHRLLNMDVVTS
jgi:hypothetical protein